MSYTFTSPIKNVANHETLNHSSEIKRKIDNLFEKCESILIVGWRQSSDGVFVKHVLNKGKKLTIVEIFPENLNNMPPEVTGICADIRDFKVESKFDMFLFQHGPEHVEKIDVSKFLDSYGHMFKVLILESPNGFQPQSAMYGNPHEEHISGWIPEDYERLGFDYILYAGPNYDSFILAYKVNENI